jgi:GNAT superfamily N-acetyltransferase
MQVKKVSSVLDLCEVIRLANQHTHAEYDCDFNTYAAYMVNAYFTPGYKLWIAIDDGFPVGYLFVYRDKVVLNEIRVVDIFVLPDFQKKGVGLHLIQALIPYAVEEKVKRVKWNSTRFPETKFWEKFSPVKVHKEEIFYSTSEDYYNNKEK